MGFFGIMFVVFISVTVAAAAVGFILVWRAKKKGELRKEEKSVTDNVADLNDRFNRARYQDKDGN